MLATAIHFHRWQILDKGERSKRSNLLRYDNNCGFKCFTVKALVSMKREVNINNSLHIEREQFFRSFYMGLTSAEGQKIDCFK